MLRWRGLDEIPSDWGRCVVTIGIFDGVHRGHQELIRRTVAAAKERGLPSVLLTFDPHPVEVLRPGSHPAQLTTLRRKAELVEQLGIDVFAVLPFTLEVSRIPAPDFVHEVLVDKLHVATVVVGENFTFGAKAAGNVGLLRELGARFGFVTEGAELQGGGMGVPVDDAAGRTIAWSSTYVRSCIDAGDVEAAADALGRPHRLEGIIVRGAGRGHDMGYPTANLSTPRYAAIPADGIYSCWFQHSAAPERRLRAAISVGTNPTFSGKERTVEAYVLDVTEDLYGDRVTLDFIHRLRGQIRFATSAELVEQMDDDVRRVRADLDQ